LFFCFCEEYNDEETYLVVSDIKSIAKHYLKSSFIFDLLAILPFNILIARNQFESVSQYEFWQRKFKILKLLRIPRLFELLNVNRVKKSIKDYY